MAFNSDIHQFLTPAALAAHLAMLPTPTWGVIGTTGHNTFRPTEAQWAGRRSMESMQAGYEVKGWSAGPHFYLAMGAPNRAHDGIWQMTPPTSQGVHGVTCNATHFGIELVGDFQARAPSAAQQALFLDTIAVLHRWAGLGPLFNMHRDCVRRTCPGDAFYALKPQLQVGLAQRLAAPSDPLRAEQVPGPGGTKFYCSEQAAAFYAAKGGAAFLGLALADEQRAIGQDGRQCAILRCERVIVKTALPEGTHLALLSEAKNRGWI